MEVTKSKESTQGAKEEQKPEIDPAMIDELMKGYQRPEDMTGPGGILEQLTKRVYERILGAEMSHYLGYEKGQAPQPIESLHMQLPKVLKSRGHFPSDEAATSPSFPYSRPSALSFDQRPQA